MLRWHYWPYLVFRVAVSQPGLKRRRFLQATCRLGWLGHSRQFRIGDLCRTPAHIWAHKQQASSLPDPSFSCPTDLINHQNVVFEQDLLQLQYEGVAVMKLFDRAKSTLTSSSSFSTRSSTIRSNRAFASSPEGQEKEVPSGSFSEGPFFTSGNKDPAYTIAAV